MYSQDLKLEDIETGPQLSTSSIIGIPSDCVDGMADVFECSNVDLISFLSLGDIAGLDAADDVQTNSLNDIWAWEDPTNNDRYAIVGRNDGTSFVRMTDPENPVYVADLPLLPSARPNVWRDIKVYKDHAFVVADGADSAGVQIFDLRQLRDLTGDPVVVQSVAVVDTVTSAHNIVINEESGFAYVVGSNLCGRAIYMLNIDDPANPVDAGCAVAPNTGRANTGYVHDAHCLNYSGPDTEHDGKEICFSANETDIAIMDVTDKSDPVVLSTASYPNASYIHQGWVNDSHSHFVINDELDERNIGNNTTTHFWNVMDLDDPILETSFVSDLAVIDHNLYIKGDLVYQSNYEAGLRILNISDISNPKEVGFFDTFPLSNLPRFNGTWSNFPFFDDDLVVVSDQSGGLFILRASPPLLTTTDEETPQSRSRSLTVYPNPFVENVELKLPDGLEGNASLNLVDINGRNVFQKVIQSLASDSRIHLDLSSLAAGNYLLRLETNNQIYTSKLVKN